MPVYYHFANEPLALFPDRLRGPVVSSPFLVQKVHYHSAPVSRRTHYADFWRDHEPVSMVDLLYGGYPRQRSVYLRPRQPTLRQLYYSQPVQQRSQLMPYPSLRGCLQEHVDEQPSFFCLRPQAIQAPERMQQRTVPAATTAEEPQFVRAHSQRDPRRNRTKPRKVRQQQPRTSTASPPLSQSAVTSPQQQNEQPKETPSSPKSTTSSPSLNAEPAYVSSPSNSQASSSRSSPITLVSAPEYVMVDGSVYKDEEEVEDIYIEA